MPGRVKYRYNSLEDFLSTNPLTIDAEWDDEWGAKFPIKGREIYAAILFADISSFSRETRDLSPTATLIYLNTFFTWITAEALRGTTGIIDKYIGDEVMVVFSEEFGSSDPFADAVQTARWIGERDLHAFRPHVGIASGVAIVGFVGTPQKYNCSILGAPVTLARRCAGQSSSKFTGPRIVSPAALWAGRSFEALFPPRKYSRPDGTISEQEHSWELLPPQKVTPKNLPELEIIEIVNHSFYLQDTTAAERATKALHELEGRGLYTPRKF